MVQQLRKAGVIGSIPGWRTEIPQATGRPSWWAATTEPVLPWAKRAHTQQWRPCVQQLRPNTAKNRWIQLNRERKEKKDIEQNWTCKFSDCQGNLLILYTIVRLQNKGRQKVVRCNQKERTIIKQQQIPDFSNVAMDARKQVHDLFLQEKITVNYKITQVKCHLRVKTKRP